MGQDEQRTTTGPPEPELEAARQAAAEADSAAEAARAAIERMRSSPESDASRERRSSESDRPAPTPTPPAPASDRQDEAAREREEELRRATEAAREAAREAREAAKEARAVANVALDTARRWKERFARTGLLVGVGGFYALEDFGSSDGLDIDDSFGGAAWIGYRVHPHIAVELRGEILDGFDIELDSDAGAFREAKLGGFLVTAGPKLYAFTGPIQPFVGMGFGAMRGIVEGQRNDGSRFGDRATASVFRPAAGLDVFLSELLVLNLEAAYVVPGGQLSDLEFGVFSTGLTYRF